MLLHALAVGSAVVFLGDLKLVPEPEPFKWDVALVEAPELKPVEQPAPSRAKPEPVAAATEPTEALVESQPQVETQLVQQPVQTVQAVQPVQPVEQKVIRQKDRFLVGGVPTDFVRDGKLVPNVVRNVLNFKEEYEHPSGWGGWFETSYWDSYFLNNANTVAAPAYWLMNVSLHKNFEFKNNPYIRFAKFYGELDNIADKTYVASGNVVADSTADASKTLFFAGYGRALYAGVTLGF